MRRSITSWLKRALLIDSTNQRWNRLSWWWLRPMRVLLCPRLIRRSVRCAVKRRSCLNRWRTSCKHSRCRSKQPQKTSSAWIHRLKVFALRIHWRETTRSMQQRKSSTLRETCSSWQRNKSQTCTNSNKRWKTPISFLRTYAIKSSQVRLQTISKLKKSPRTMQISYRLSN